MWKALVVVLFFLSFALTQAPLSTCQRLNAVKDMSKGYNSSTSNSCRLNPGNSFFAGIYGVAANIDQCGVCLRVSGSLGSVILTIVDVCAGNCSGVNQLVLSADAYDGVIGVASTQVKYQIVSCAVTGSLQYVVQEGSSLAWSSFQILNNRVGISRVEIMVSGGQWIPLTRQPYNFWTCSQSTSCSGLSYVAPISIRITSVTGEILTDINALSQTQTWPTQQTLTGPISFLGTVQFSSSIQASNSTYCDGSRYIAPSIAPQITTRKVVTTASIKNTQLPTFQQLQTSQVQQSSNAECVIPSLFILLAMLAM